MAGNQTPKISKKKDWYMLPVPLAYLLRGVDAFQHTLIANDCQLK